MEERLLQFISSRLGEGKVVNADQSLIASGLVDSLEFILILAFIEKEFGIAFSLQEVRLADFDTAASIACMVRERMTGTL